MAQDLEIRIKTAIENAEAVKNVGDLKKSLKELKSLGLEVGDNNSEAFKKINKAIGETLDKQNDLNSAFKSMSGEPIENISNSFKGLKSSLMSLDFKGAKTMFNNLNTSVMDLGKSILGIGPGANMASVAIKGFGMALAAIGITAIIAAVVLLVKYWDDLKTSTGALGDVVRTLSKKFDELKKQVFEFADKALTGLINGFVEVYNKSMFVRGAIEAIKLTFKTAVDYIVTGAKIIGNTFTTLGKAISDVIQFKDPTEGIKKGFADVEKNVKDFGDNFKKNLTEAIDNTKNSTLKPIKSLFGEFKKGGDGANKDLDKVYSDMLKKLESSLEARRKLIDDEYNVKETQIYKDYANGVIKTEEEMNNKLDALNISKLNDRKSLILKELDEVNANTKIKSEDRIKLLAVLNDQILKLDQDLAKAQIKERKKIDDATNKSLEKNKKDAETAFQLLYGKKKLKLIQDFNNGIIKNKEELDSALRDLDLQRAKDELTQLDINTREYIDKLTEIANIESQIRQQSLNESKKIEDEKSKDRQKALNDSLAAVSKITEAGIGINTLGQNILNSFSNISSSVSSFITKMGDDTATMTDKIGAGLQMVGSLANEIGNILAANSQRNLQDIQNEEAEKVASLERQRDAGIITEDQLQQGKSKINAAARKKELAEKKKAFNQEKAMKIIQTVISTAQGVVTAMANMFPLNVIMAAITGAVGAAQIGIIASQKFPEGGSAGGGGSTNPSLPSVGSVSSQANQASSSSSPKPSSFFGLGQTNMNDKSGGDKRVYVVESDITDTQDRVAKIRQRSTLGG